MYTDTQIFHLENEIFSGLIPKTFTEQQIQFCNDMLKVVLTDTDTSFITTIAARCGLGKSTFIKAFVTTIITDRALRIWPTGAVIVTNSIDRLEDYRDIPPDESMDELNDSWGLPTSKELLHNWTKRVEIMTSKESFTTQMISQKYKPVVMLTTQRYFRLDPEKREELFRFNWAGKEYPRQILIFDEKPDFFSINPLSDRIMNEIDTALKEGLTEQEPQKVWAYTQFEDFRDYFSVLSQKIEDSNEGTFACYHLPDRKFITPNGENGDKRFLNIIIKNLSDIYPKKNDILCDIQLIQKFLSEGGIFYRNTKADGNYERGFQIITDNEEAFYFGSDRKVFVFDATADIDPDYENHPYIRYVEGLEKYDAHIPLTINLVDEITSRTKIANKKTKDAKERRKRIRDFLLENNVDRDQTLLLTYMIIESEFASEYGHHAHFNGIRGVNTFRDYSTMAHIGLNRWSNLDYFLRICANDHSLIEKLRSMTEEESVNFFGKVSQNKDKKIRDIMQPYIAKMLITDFEQNVFRLSIRNYESTLPAEVWLFFHVDSTEYGLVNEMLNDRFENHYSIDEIKPIEKIQQTEKDWILNRTFKSGKESRSQIILNYILSLPIGAQYTPKEVYEAVGLTPKQFYKALEKNKSLRDVLKKDWTGRKGIYIRR